MSVPPDFLPLTPTLACRRRGASAQGKADMKAELIRVELTRAQRTGAALITKDQAQPSTAGQENRRLAFASGEGERMPGELPGDGKLATKKGSADEALG